MKRRDLNKLTQPQARKLRLLASRGIVTLVDAAGPYPRVQVQPNVGALLNNVRLFEPYGFFAHPHEGGEVLCLSIGGNRSHTVAVMVADGRYRPADVQPGESGLYDHRGCEISIRDGALHITGVDIPVIVNGHTVQVTATDAISLQAPTINTQGDINHTGGWIVNGHDLGEGHAHKKTDQTGVATGGVV